MAANSADDACLDVGSAGVALMTFVRRELMRWLRRKSGRPGVAKGGNDDDGVDFACERNDLLHARTTPR